MPPSLIYNSRSNEYQDLQPVTITQQCSLFFDILEKGIFTISERRECPAHSAERSKDTRK